MNKMLKLSALSLGLTAMFATGVLAAPAIQEINAYLRPDIKLVVDGTVQAMNSWDGTSVIPISYNGTTYLPLRALGKVLNKTVTWDDNTQTVYLGATTIQDQIVTNADAQINSFDIRVTALAAEIDGLVPAVEFSDRVKQYLSLSAKVDTLDHEMDVLSDQLERDYKNGKLTYTAYHNYDTRLDAIQLRLDQAEDRLIAKTVKDSDLIKVDDNDDDDDDDDDKASYAYKIHNAHGQTTAFNNRFAALEKQAKKLIADKKAGKGINNYQSVLNKLGSLDDEIDELIDRLEDAYEDHGIAKDLFEKYDKTLEDIADQIEDIEDLLKGAGITI